MERTALGRVRLSRFEAVRTKRWTSQSFSRKRSSRVRESDTRNRAVILRNSERHLPQTGDVEASGDELLGDVLASTVTNR